MGRARSGCGTISASVPSKSSRMPAADAFPRSASRSAQERGVVVAEVDGELHVAADVLCVGIELLDLHVGEILEEVVREELGLDLVLVRPVVDGGDRYRRRGVGRVLCGDVAVLVDQR